MESMQNKSMIVGKRKQYDDEEDDLADFLESQKAPQVDDVGTELEYYLKDQCWPHSDDFDFLAWWKTNEIKFPLLQALARDFLAIPVSTVASESVFSMSGRLVNPHRSRLQPDTIEVLMSTRSWLGCSTSDGADCQVNICEEGEADLDLDTSSIPNS